MVKWYDHPRDFWLIISRNYTMFSLPASASIYHIGRWGGNCSRTPRTMSLYGILIDNSMVLFVLVQCATSSCTARFVQNVVGHCLIKLTNAQRKRIQYNWQMSIICKCVSSIQCTGGLAPLYARTFSRGRWCPNLGFVYFGEQFVGTGHYWAQWQVSRVNGRQRASPKFHDGRHSGDGAL